MAIAVTIGTVPLEEIHELGWPTDRHLVFSFRRTLQHGGHFAPMQLNRVWQPGALWRYEIIDGFHRYEAAKAEGVTELLCQVVEIGNREARYARIQACVGKPAEVTRSRALHELRLAFIADMRTELGEPSILMEPVLGEDGQVHARRRAAPLPGEPLAALEAFTDHLLVTSEEPPPGLVSPDLLGKGLTAEGIRAGWERALKAWLAELGQRFGYDADWLLQELHIHSLQAQGLGQGWTAHQHEAFQHQGGYAFHALLLWKIPDVELRAWFQRQVQADPAKGEWLWKALQLLGFQGTSTETKSIKTFPKSVLLTLLSRYPSPREFYQAVRDRLEESAPTPVPPPQQPIVPQIPAPPLPSSSSSMMPVSTQEKSLSETAIFAIGSPSFVAQPTALSPSVVPASPPTTSAAPPRSSEPGGIERTSEPSRPDSTSAYEPVHLACVALFQAIETLTAQYGQEWQHWEQAQADLAQLRTLLALG